MVSLRMAGLIGVLVALVYALSGVLYRVLRTVGIDYRATYAAVAEGDAPLCMGMLGAAKVSKWALLYPARCVHAVRKQAVDGVGCAAACLHVQ